MHKKHIFSDKIIIKNMGFYAFHGAMAEENKLGQRFFIDLECGINLAKAGNSDDVNDTVSYADIYQSVKQSTEGTKYKLIEALAHNIAKRLFAQFAPIKSIKITVRKPEAPIPTVSGEVAIQIFRKRKENG